MGCRAKGENAVLSIIRIITLAVLVAFAGSAPGMAAETYPSRPVRLVVGFAAGGPTDVISRVMAQWLSDRLGQQFVVENKTGAGGNLATETVINARPDGYTVLVVATANAINTTLYPSLPFDFFRDAIPIAGLARISYVVAVPQSSPAKTIAEFIALAKAKPGELNFASGGTGGSSHLAVEIFKGVVGIDVLHIPYRGNAAAYPDVISGRVHMIFADYGSVRPHLESNALRAIAVTSLARWDTMPGVPTVAETVPGYEASAWYGFAVPKGTPTDVIDTLNKTINAGLTDPATKARLAQLDAMPIVATPAEFTAFMKAEAERWGQAVRASGAKPQ
jgi:tripartite-type tricarboxylate transporter receptor subunit TctC